MFPEEFFAVINTGIGMEPRLSTETEFYVVIAAVMSLCRLLLAVPLSAAFECFCLPEARDRSRGLSATKGYELKVFRVQQHSQMTNYRIKK